MSAPRLDDHLCFSIYSAQQALSRAYQPMLDRLGLTYTQYLAMVVLWEEDGQTIGAVGARLGLATNTVTPLLKRLEAAGLILRKRCRRDERRMLVHLTDQGRTLEEAAQPISRTVARSAGLTGAEAQALKDWIVEVHGRLIGTQPNNVG